MYFVLHGQTQLNVSGRAQGRTDSPLTVEGLHEAEALGAKLREIFAGELPQAIICSPLGRSRATAAVIATALDCDIAAITHDARLDEVDLGVWEGLTQSDIQRGWPEEMRGTNPFDWCFRAPAGERYEDVRRRSASWLEDLGDHAEVVVVGHGLASRVLRGVYVGLCEARAIRLDIDRNAILRLEEREIIKIRAG
jgi:broad specificity phosphatase PhoE